jgi:hypothetical protein
VVADDGAAGAAAGALGDESPPQADSNAVAMNRDDNRRGEVGVGMRKMVTAGFRG